MNCNCKPRGPTSDLTMEGQDPPPPSTSQKSTPCDRNFVLLIMIISIIVLIFLSRR